MIRVLLVDDHPSVRKGLSRLLDTEADMEVVGEAADGTLAIKMAHALRPDVVLMDINMPVMNGIEATRTIRAQCPQVQVIGMSITDQAQPLLDAGAVSYVSKAEDPRRLLAAIRACARPMCSVQPDHFAGSSTLAARNPAILRKRPYAAITH